MVEKEGAVIRGLCLEEARYEVYDLSRLLDSTSSRFIDDYVIPTLTVASCFIPGAQGVAVPRALVATCSRIAPVFERIAVSYGATQIYRELNKFFKEQFKGENSKQPSVRIQNSPNDVMNYFSEVRNMRVLGKGRATRDGYWVYEIIENFTYKGLKFKKGQFLSRDRKHGEIELFRDKDYHLGAIEPKNGTLYKKRDPGRRLKF